MESKICKSCATEKSINDFPPKRRVCITCCNQKLCEYRKNNLEKVREIKKAWRLKNRLKEIERNRKWKAKVKNDDILLKKQKDLRNEYLKNKRKTDMMFRMKEAMRRMVRRTVLRKTDSTSKLLGYSPSELKQHLESLFTEGMSWDNYGKWEIDHVRPIGSFEIETPPSIINALSNLQPLWREDNNAKRDMY